MSRRGLPAVLVILGTVMVVAGGQTVLTGGAEVMAGGAVSDSVDSELRSYATWYMAAGVVLLRAVPRVESRAE